MLGRHRLLTQLVFLAQVWFLVPTGFAQDDFERPPINYVTATPDNLVSRLEQRIVAGNVQLRFEEPWGYLRSVLKELQVPESSQMLVFSKTSLQRNRISPRTPRAIYFNDDVYIGYCRTGEVLEVSVADPQLGTVYYTLDQAPQERPVFDRQTDNCLLCHGGSNTRGVPGHLVRSVYPDAAGQPMLASGSHRIDHTSPLEHRWGGWYVTGTHGEQTHLGNRIFKDRADADRRADPATQNLQDLGTRFDRSAYLTPHSDLIALMLLEHQAGAHNVLVRAGFDSRMALYREEALNRELSEPAGHRWDSTTLIVNNAAEQLVKYFLFSGEAALTSPVTGSTSFSTEFAAHAPRDARGRSLKDLDLQTRLLKYPCSYLIYSESFDTLPDEVRNRFWQRLGAVLEGSETAKEFSHLDAADRAAIREILLATKPAAARAWDAR